MTVEEEYFNMGICVTDDLSGWDVKAVYKKLVNDYVVIKKPRSSDYRDQYALLKGDSQLWFVEGEEIWSIYYFEKEKIFSFCTYESGSYFMTVFGDILNTTPAVKSDDFAYIGNNKYVIFLENKIEIYDFAGNMLCERNDAVRPNISNITDYMNDENSIFVDEKNGLFVGCLYDETDKAEYHNYPDSSSRQTLFDENLNDILFPGYHLGSHIIRKGYDPMKIIDNTDFALIRGLNPVSPYRCDTNRIGLII